MTDSKRNADRRRAEAKRARRLAATLSQPVDQERLKQYAADLEREAVSLQAEMRKPSDKEKRKP